MVMGVFPVATLAVLKKLSPASIADAATNVVLATVPIAVFSVVLRLAAVAAGVLPIRKLPVGGGDVVVNLVGRDPEFYIG